MVHQTLLSGCSEHPLPSADGSPELLLHPLHIERPIFFPVFFLARYLPFCRGIVLSSFRARSASHTLPLSPVQPILLERGKDVNHFSAPDEIPCPDQSGNEVLFAPLLTQAG